MLTAAWEARLRRRPLRLRRRRWCHERTPDATELPGGVEPLPEEVELVSVAPCERVHLCVRIFAVPRASGSVRVTGDPSVLDCGYRTTPGHPHRACGSSVTYESEYTVLSAKPSWRKYTMPKSMHFMSRESRDARPDRREIDGAPGPPGAPPPLEQSVQAESRGPFHGVPRGTGCVGHAASRAAEGLCTIPSST